MAIKSLYLVFGILIVIFSFSPGCITPPKETVPNISESGTYDPSSGSVDETTATPTTPSYVTMATPYSTATPAEIPYQTLVTSTPNPEDQVCLIYFTSQTYAYNKTAFSVYLKNPPMYINYSVIDPIKLKGTKVISSRSGGHEDQIINYEYYNPLTSFEITVRDKNTGQIYVQNGFGIKYSEYTNNTLKILKSGDLLVEMGGNNVTATTGVWVKPYGNFDNFTDFNNTECMSSATGVQIGQKNPDGINNN
jgi:hypothetical protein